MNGPQLKRMAIVVGSCAAVGAVAGIAGSAAAPSSKSNATPAQAAQAKQAQASVHARVLGLRAVKRGLLMGVPGPFGPGFAGGPVHAQAVIPKPDGSGFLTITTDAGTLNSVDGTTLHIKEATDKATYKDDVAVDVGSDAHVIRNGQAAKLSDLKTGDHVRAITGAPRGTFVIAEDDAFVAKEKQRFQQFKKQLREHGFERRRFRFGPPPGVPGAFPGAPGGWNGPSSGSSSGGSNS